MENIRRRERSSGGLGRGWILALGLLLSPPLPLARAAETGLGGAITALLDQLVPGLEMGVADVAACVQSPDKDLSHLALAVENRLLLALAARGGPLGVVKVPWELCSADQEAVGSWAKGEGVERVIRVRVVLEGDQLGLSGEALAGDLPYWLGLVSPPPSPVVGVYFAQLSLEDPEVKMLAGPRPLRVPVLKPLALEKLKLHTMALEGPGPVAGCAGDLDGDGRDEIVTVGLDRVVALSFRAWGEPLREMSRIALDVTSPRHPYPSGQAVWIRGADGSPGVAVHTSLSPQALLLGWKAGLVRRGSLGGVPLLARGPVLMMGRPAAGRAAYDALRALPVAEEGPSPEGWSPLARPVVAMVGWRGPRGEEVRAQAGLDGVVRVTGLDRALDLTLKDRGFALALADLDGDGLPEIITTSDGVWGEADRMEIHRITSEGRAHRVWSSGPLKGSLGAVMTGDIDGNKVLEVMALQWAGPSGGPQLLVVGAP